MHSKQRLREALCQRRSAYPEEKQHAAAAALSDQLQAHASFLKQGAKVAVYAEVSGEIPLNYVIDFFWQTDVVCYLPMIEGARQLVFAPYGPETRLLTGRYGILVPDVARVFCLMPHELDVVLMPLVAYDKQGHRLGMGGGYYDTSFSFLSQKKNKKPMLIGCAYPWQCVEDVPVEPFDLSLDAVLTSEGMTFF